MNTYLRAMFWVLSVVTCAAVIYCGYHIEKPLAVVWPVEAVAIWGSVAVLVFAIGLFFAMPPTRNGRIGLLVGLLFVAFSAYSSYHALSRTKFLYRTVDIAVNIESEGGETVRVGGMMAAPVNRFELPVAILMPDDSPNAYARNIYYAKALARRGIAAVAYGRQGAPGGSTLAPADLETRGEDVIYILDLLEKMTELNMRRAGVVGFSENEWVIPYTLQKTTRLYFGALLAPSGMNPTERVLANLDQRLRSEGLSTEDVEAAKSLAADLAVNLQEGDVGEKRLALIERWDEAKSTEWFKAAGFPEETPQIGSTGPVATNLGFSAAELWRQVDVPILIVAGASDPQSLPETLRERFNQYFTENEKKQWELEIIPSANHELLVGGDNFGDLSADFPPGLFDSLAQWVVKATAPPEMVSPGSAESTP